MHKFVFMKECTSIAAVHVSAYSWLSVNAI